MNQQTISHLRRIARQFGKKVVFYEGGFWAKYINDAVFCFGRLRVERERGLIS